MLKGQSHNIFGIEKKTAFTNIMLVANAFVWYYACLDFLQKTLTSISLNNSTLILIWCLHFSGLIISAIVGASLTKKIQQNRLLVFWMILGVISSFIMLAIGTGVVAVSFFALFFGVSLGFGMPTCMGYYTNSISVDKRGRIGGIVLLSFGVGISVFSIARITDPLVLSIALAVWRLSSLVIFLSLGLSSTVETNAGIPSYKSILGQQSFLLYLVPWVMFSLVNYLSTPLQSNIVGEELAATLIMVQNGLMGIFAVLGGFLLDSVGRKRVAISGFVLFGLGTAVVGVFPRNIFSVYFSVVADGIAWGFLFVIFVLTIWGDLSHNAPSDKYYAVGVLPFFASRFLELTVGGYITASIPESASALFSFTAFFLFLAVLPLFYAPETLPEKNIRDRELKTYIEKAQKVKEKYA